MSWQLMMDVLEHSAAQGTSRTVALAFAFYVDKDTNLAYPTNDTVVNDWGMSLSSVQRGLRELQESGEFQRQPQLESRRRKRVFLIDPTFRRQSSLFDAVEGAVSPSDVTEGVTLGVRRQVGVTEGVSLVRARPKEPLERGTTPLGPPGGGAATVVVASSPLAAQGAAGSRRRRSRRRAAGETRSVAASETCPLQLGSNGSAHELLEDVWPLIATELRSRVSEDTYEIWLSKLHPHRLDDGVLIVGAPSDKILWVADRYRRLIGSASPHPVQLVGCAALERR